MKKQLEQKDIDTVCYGDEALVEYRYEVIQY